jgi:hypothetical protein
MHAGVARKIPWMACQDLVDVGRLINASDEIATSYIPVGRPINVPD